MNPPLLELGSILLTGRFRCAVPPVRARLRCISVFPLRSAPMNLGLTDDQQFFQETTRKFLEQEAPLTAVRALADDPDGFDRAWWARGAELGWTSFLVPEDDGGGSLSGEGLVDLAIVAEEMGRLVSPGPLVPTNVVADAVAAAARPSSGPRCCPAIVAGEVVAAWCIAGPGGGWDAHGGRGRARRRRRRKVASCSTASARRSSAGAQADELLVTARDRRAGSPSAWCRRRRAGVHVEPIESVDLVRRFATVHLDGVRVRRDRHRRRGRRRAPRPSSASCTSRSCCSARRPSVRSTACSSSPSSTSPTAARSADRWRRTRRSSTASPT